VRGRAQIVFKLKGNKNRTNGTSPEAALRRLKQGLFSGKKAYIYHCYNHYFCPIGFEEMPLKQEHCFKKELGCDETESQLIVADNSRKHPSFHCIKWEDIVKDLKMENPYFLDIRKLHKGIQNKRDLEEAKQGKKGSNSHCIIEFTALD